VGVKLGLILRKKHILRLSENMMLKKIFGPMRDEVNRGMERTTS
jgi:hypothetical protein